LHDRELATTLWGTKKSMQGTWQQEGQHVELFGCSIQLHGKKLMNLNKICNLLL
jgi:hypothetical protein